MKKMKIAVAIMVTAFLMLSETEESKCQQIGFDFPSDQRKMVIEFERYNNLIVIPITINNSITLKFILDTGVQYPILTEKIFGEFLNLEYSQRLVVEGPGKMDSISAMVARNVDLRLPGGIKSGENQSLLVLERDYLDLKSSLGADVYGIIGYDIFSRFTVEINYDEGQLTLHEPKKYRPRKKYRKIPLKIVNTKPYVNVGVTLENNIKKEMQFMVDTGASHALLFDSPDEDFLPENRIVSVIGRGLGGDINGHLGRVEHIQLDKFIFNNPLVSFPVEGQYGNVIKRGSRNGTIGGEIITRFNVVFDYLHETLYVKKGRSYTRKFEHDMSGLNIVFAGRKNDKIRVNSVRIESPAYRAGIRSGDVIETINGYSPWQIKLSDINGYLRSKVGKKINIKYTRNDQVVKTSFRLERYI